MATVKQALDDTEKYLRSQLKQFGFDCDHCRLKNVSAANGDFIGKVSQDGKKWYSFTISDKDTEVKED